MGSDPAQASGMVYVSRLDGQGQDPVDLHRCRRFPLCAPNEDEDRRLVYYLTPEGRWVKYYGGLSPEDGSWYQGFSETVPPEVAYDFGRHHHYPLPPELEPYQKYYVDSDAYFRWHAIQNQPTCDDVWDDGYGNEPWTFCEHCGQERYLKAERCWSCKRPTRPDVRSAFIYTAEGPVSVDIDPLPEAMLTPANPTATERTEAPAVRPPEADRTPPPQTPDPHPPIVLDGPDEEPTVLGKVKPRLTHGQYRVVKALLNAHPERLSKDTLASRSDTEDPIGMIDRLRDRDEDWAAVLDKPGQPHGGYGIQATPRKTKKHPETRPRTPRRR